MSPRIVARFLALLAFAAPCGHAAIPSSQRDALLALYASTHGGAWTDNSGWNGAAGTECAWFGVTCDGTGSTVTTLRLGNNNLAGSLPPLDGLPDLTFLDAKRNQLSGSIPSLASLTKLAFLDVQHNQLSGRLPSLAALTALTIVDLKDNQLSGQLPPPPAGLFAAQSSLCPNRFEHLEDPDWNRATGATPWWTDCTPPGPIWFGGTPWSGNQVTFTAVAGAQRYEWDVDDDGVIDRSGTSNELSVSYPGEFDGMVAVTSTSSAGARTTAKQPLTILAPHLVVSANGAPVELCGSGDGMAQPGKRFGVPIRVTNIGFRPMVDGYATFVAQDRLDAAASGTAIAGKLTIETPLVGVGNLAPGASVDTQAVVTIANDAACGSNLGLLFRGGVDVLSSGPGQDPAIASFSVPAGNACAPFAGACASAPKALVTPRQGLYLNSNRPGNGLSNFVIPQNGAPPVYFGAWFTAGADHDPTWYIVQAPVVGNVAVGPILRFTRDVAAPTFAVRSSVVGAAVVTLKDAEKIAFLWQIGARSGIELMDYFVGGAAPAPNRTGAWFNAGESGWGQVVHAYVAGGANNLFVVDYLYDDAGQPRWVLGQQSTDGFAVSTPHQTFQVHCPGCPWIADWNSFPIAVGTGSESFIDSSNGRATTAFALPAAFPGAWNRASLPITLLSVPQ